MGLFGVFTGWFTSRKALATAREQRVWDRKADLYIDLVEYAITHERRLDLDDRVGRSPGNSSAVAAWFQGVELPRDLDLAARVRTYAHASVRKAFDDVVSAEKAFHDDETNESLELADRALDTLVRAVRADLHPGTDA